MAPANLLQIPKMLIRRAALSFGPITVTYGLDAVCNNAKPVPITNKPVKNTAKVLDKAAGIKIIVPIAIIHKPIIIPFLKPIFFKTHAEGKAIIV